MTLTDQSTATARPTTPAAFLAVTLTQAKEQLKISQSVSGHDAELTRLLTSTIQLIQGRNKIVGAQTTYTWSPILAAPKIRLPFRNVTAVSSVTYVDEDDAIQTVPPADYELDLSTLWPQLALTDQSGSWPTVSATAVQPWTVVFTAGATAIGEVLPEFTDLVLSWLTPRWHQDIDQGGKVFEALEGNQVSVYL